jgi:mRNA interferase MazF
MRRGEIWLINLDQTVGAEIRKTRPTVIVNDDAVGILPLKVVVPVTEWKDRYAVAPWMVRLDPDADNGLSKPSAADAFQVRSVAQQRFVQLRYRLPERGSLFLFSGIGITDGLTRPPAAKAALYQNSN